MSNKFEPIKPTSQTEFRQQVRRRMLLLMLLVPALCALPALVFVAPAGPVRLVIAVVWLSILGATLAVGWGALRQPPAQD